MVKVGKCQKWKWNNNVVFYVQVCLWQRDSAVAKRAGVSGGGDDCDECDALPAAATMRAAGVLANPRA